MTSPLNYEDEPIIHPLLLMAAHLLLICPSALGNKKTVQKDYFAELNATYPQEFRVRSRCNLHPVVVCEKCSKVYDATAFGALEPVLWGCKDCVTSAIYKPSVPTQLMRRVLVEAMITYAPNQFYNNPIGTAALKMQKYWNDNNSHYKISRDLQLEVGDL